MASRKRRTPNGLAAIEADDQPSELPHGSPYTREFAGMVNERAKEPATFLRRGEDDGEDGEPGTLFDRV
jgi:hypothetical protein